MKSLISSSTKIHFVQLETEDDILLSLTEYCKSNINNSGIIIGIGAVKKANLGYFDVDQKQYLTQQFEFNAELVQCTGNITRNASNGEIIVHLHMAIGDSHYKLLGGHVLPGCIISVTGEFIIIETDALIQREKNHLFDLLLWKI